MHYLAARVPSKAKIGRSIGADELQSSECPVAVTNAVRDIRLEARFEQGKAAQSGLPTGVLRGKRLFCCSSLTDNGVSPTAANTSSRAHR